MAIKKWLSGLALCVVVACAAAADKPKLEDYRIGPKNLPPLEAEGGPFSIVLDEARMTFSTATSFPIAGFQYGSWRPDENGVPVRVEESAIGIQVMDSPAFTSVHRMQFGNSMMAGCFERISGKPAGAPNVAFDGFLAKPGEGCPLGQLVLLISVDNEDRFVVMIVADNRGNIEPKPLQAWLQAVAAKLDYKKLASLPKPPEGY